MPTCCTARAAAQAAACFILLACAASDACQSCGTFGLLGYAKASTLHAPMTVCHMYRAHAPLASCAWRWRPCDGGARSHASAADTDLWRALSRGGATGVHQRGHRCESLIYLGEVVCLDVDRDAPLALDAVNHLAQVDRPSGPVLVLR